MVWFGRIHRCFIEEEPFNRPAVQNMCALGSH